MLKLVRQFGLVSEFLLAGRFALVLEILWVWELMLDEVKGRWSSV